MDIENSLVGYLGWVISPVARPLDNTNRRNADTSMP
jgi:hypothetical protein